VSLIAILFVLLSANRNIYNEQSYIANEVIDSSVVTNTTIEIPLVTTPTTQETLISTTSTSTTSTTTSTTTTIPTIIGISDDSESVQIIDEEVVEESSLYEGPYSSFAGYEGENQILLDNEVAVLPIQIKILMESKVIFINGCHQYAKSVVGRCPYGVWDSSGTNPDGTKGSEWKLSIWISNRAFSANEYKDVLLHEASHALSFLTRECLDNNNDNYRKNAWEYFGGEEKFADSIVLYFGGSYNHYRDTGPLSTDEVDFLDGYINTCLG